MTRGRILRVAVAVLTMTFAVSMASAQAINSGAQAIALNATLSESLTLSLSAAAVNFTLAAGNPANPGSTPITATTTWTLKPGRTAVGVYAYFGNAAQALGDGAGNFIPSTAFFISDNGGAQTALTSTVAFGGANAGYQMANVPITGLNKSANHTDAMVFNINLTTLPQLPASTYTGTLNIQAQATP